GLLLLLIGLWSLPAQRTKAYKYATQFISYTILLTVFFLGVRILYGMDFTKLVNWIINIMALGSLSILLVAILHYFSLRPKAKH
ncbi:MAG: hypothetical protein Q4F57_06365, partial [Weeksellaceae bacterium]|nr:hypothetical protein [Weeksellaceae bacterium]